jgi:hypothetical protein
VRLWTWQRGGGWTLAAYKNRDGRVAARVLGSEGVRYKLFWSGSEEGCLGMVSWLQRGGLRAFLR